MTVHLLHPPHAGLLAYLSDLLSEAEAGNVDGVIVIVQRGGEPTVAFVGDLDARAAALGFRVAEAELDRRLVTTATPAAPT